MNEERQRILKRIMYSPGLTFSELWAKEGESNRFAYHLKVLEEDGLVAKEGSTYSLTHRGKRYAAYVDGETGKQNRAPLLGIIVVIYDAQADRFLMLRREREPFYGYWGFHGGKMEFGQYILECAQAEVAQETGLTCALELKGLYSSKTYNDGELAYNHQMFIVRASDPRGELIVKTREGENRWVAREELASLRAFPDLVQLAQIALGEGFRWIEADKLQENDAFTGMKVLRDERL